MPLFRRIPAPPPDERYVTLLVLGEGGSARVSRVLDAALGRLAARKDLKGSDPGVRRAFEREARIACYLDHPGVAPIYDRVQGPAGEPGYVMKEVVGTTLAEHLGYSPRGGGRALGVAEAVGLLLRIGETLAYAHDRGVVHLDLKPDNVMMGRYGEVLLMDWGNARVYDAGPYRAWLGAHADEHTIELLTAEPADLVSGTPRFMSPEQTSRPRDTLGKASDVYAAGALLYLLLTGAHPHDAPTTPELFRKIREEEPVPVHERNAEVPRGLSGIVARMIARRETDRYADLHAVLADLRRFQDAGQGFPVRELDPGEILFEEGAPGDAAYVILRGRVAIEKHSVDGRRRLTVLGPGEVFGEIAILTGEKRSASVRAVEATTVRVMARQDVERELAKIPPWVDAMVRTMGQRFLALNDELARRRPPTGA